MSMIQINLSLIHPLSRIDTYLLEQEEEKMTEIIECEYCSCDLAKGMNWWFEIAICNDCHNERVNSDSEYQARLAEYGD